MSEIDDFAQKTRRRMVAAQLYSILGSEEVTQQQKTEKLTDYIISILISYETRIKWLDKRISWLEEQLAKQFAKRRGER